MDLSNLRKNQHLLWRAGFGPLAEDLGNMASATPASFTDALWKASSRPVTYLDVADNTVKGLLRQRKELSPEEKKQLRRQSQQDIKSLNLTWLSEMANSDAQLREKMALWGGTYARSPPSFYRISIHGYITFPWKALTRMSTRLHSSSAFLRG